MGAFIVPSPNLIKKKQLFLNCSDTQIISHLYIGFSIVV